MEKDALYHYVSEVVPMKNIQRQLISLVLAACASGTHAAPTISSTLFYTDAWSTNQASPSLNGNYLHMFTAVESPYKPPDLSATATRGGTVLNLSFYTTPIFAQSNFETFLTNTARTGAWVLRVTDPTGTADGLFPAINNAQFLPFVSNLHITGGGLTPTINWSLPDLTGFDVDDLRVRAVVANTGQQVFQSDRLNPATTDFTLPANVLKAGIGYEFRVLLEDFEGTRLENRSNTFTSVYTSAVPEPGSLALTALAFATLTVFSRRRRHGKMKD
jgi:hypothetical protein